MDILASIGELETKETQLRGKPITLRAVTALESAQLEKQYPRPRPQGALTPEQRLAEENHPAFVARLTRYMATRRCILVAIAAGGAITLDGAPWNLSRDAEWLEKLADAMQAKLTEAEILELYAAVVELCQPIKPAETVIGTGTSAGN